jgi:hypothetical protein
MLSSGLVALIIIFISYKVGKIIATNKCKHEQVKLENESHSSQKSLKRILEEEKNQVVVEKNELTVSNRALNERLEDYRKKLAGMGLLSFSGNKKRSDILYSLLMENEALEQLISELGKKLANEQGEHLIHRMKDIRKRQRLIAEIFNDDTIRNYVKEVLSDDDKIDNAVHKIEDSYYAKPADESSEMKKLK